MLVLRHDDVCRIMHGRRDDVYVPSPKTCVHGVEIAPRAFCFTEFIDTTILAIFLLEAASVHRRLITSRIAGSDYARSNWNIAGKVIGPI